jgi:hypothetical protein
VVWAHGVFLATHPPVDRPETAALIEQLLTQTSAQSAAEPAVKPAANQKEAP